MNHSERILMTLGFEKRTERGAVLETFFPWDKTINRWCEEGLPKEYSPSRLYPPADGYMGRYLSDQMSDPVYAYERYLGFDGVKRMAFRIPFSCFDETVMEETDTYMVRLDTDGWVRKYHRNSNLVEEVKAPVTGEEDWNALKEKVREHLALYCTDENIRKVYGRYVAGHEAGDYSIRFRLTGFFWLSRMLMGIEEQMYAFYDMPEVLHDMNQFAVDIYKEYLDKVFDIIQPEVLLLEEDLSGCNGPMISPDIFNEFVGDYYRQLFPFLKEKGVKNVFIDTDGDFNRLIPDFIEAGVDGFLPMDVNAGMDIVQVRQLYPGLKFIGGFNKLTIEEGKEAIDREFERILPVIRSGGYVPGCDHQATPDSSFDNYRYYIKRLKEVMEEAGRDI